MKRRWRFLAGVASFLLLGIVLSFPPVHWRLIGWVKGEAFYQGRPRSWWRDAVRCYPVTAEEKIATFNSLFIVARVEENEGIWQKWMGSCRPDPDYHVLWNGGPAAVPILTELVSDSDEQVRKRAGAMLKQIDHAAAVRAGAFDP